ncbi:MAG TPA: MauE/DoxX family redox-associated membrane protein [Bacillales bacterium]|nr:MauE/DoxX family redox-associated membrane protein [Bacillales bacterium]
MSVIYITIVSTFSVLFMTTAMDKVIHFREHAAAMENYQIVKTGFNKPLLVLFILTEVFLIFSFFTLHIEIFNIVVALVLLGIYTLAVLINLLRGNTNIDCGCGSVLENDRLTYRMIGRNCFFMFMIILAFVIERNDTANFSVFGRIWMIMFSTGLMLVVAIIKEYLKLDRVYQFIRKIY